MTVTMKQVSERRCATKRTDGTWVFAPVPAQPTTMQLVEAESRYWYYVYQYNFHGEELHVKRAQRETWIANGRKWDDLDPEFREQILSS